MANVLIEEQVLKDIADKIRLESDMNITYKPSEMSNGIAKVAVFNYNLGQEDGYEEGYTEGLNSYIDGNEVKF